MFESVLLQSMLFGDTAFTNFKDDSTFGFLG